jgi:hypothetical protein
VSSTTVIPVAVFFKAGCIMVVIAFCRMLDDAGSSSAAETPAFKVVGKKISGLSPFGFSMILEEH